MIRRFSTALTSQRNMDERQNTRNVFTLGSFLYFCMLVRTCSPDRDRGTISHEQKQTAHRLSEPRECATASLLPSHCQSQHLEPSTRIHTVSLTVDSLTLILIMQKDSSFFSRMGLFQTWTKLLVPFS